VATALLFVLSGCGEELPKTVSVVGKVTFKDQPLTEGTVTFMPLTIPSGLPSRPAVGALRAEGTYRLSTFRPDDGAVPGEYLVVIQSIVATTPVNEFQRNRVSRIPERYGDVNRSGLRATVPSDDREEVTIGFDLTE
jgi:hypothetical protein